MIQLANFEERTFYVMLGKVVTSVDVTFTFQMTEEEFTATLTPVSSSLRATKFTFQATGYPEGQYIVKFVETGQTTVLATVAGFVSGNPIFATSQYNTYNDDGTSTTYVPSDDQGLVPSVSQKLRVSTIDQATDVSYVRYLKVTNGTLTDNGDNSVTLDTGGGGAESLNDLTDVTITGFPAGDILWFNAVTTKWVNVDLNLPLLSDTKGTPSEGQYLQYTGGFWQPATINLPSPPPSTTDGLPEGTTNLYYTEARVSANADVTANTAKVGITTAQADAIVANTAKNSYPSADATKLAGIETGAQVNTVDSVNTQTGAVVLDTDDISEGASNLYYTEARVSANSSVVANTAKNSYPTADATKLAGIAAGAEVNVNADWNASSGDAQILNKPSIPSAIGDLSDVPASLGTAGQVLAVNSGGTALEYVAQSGGGGSTVSLKGKFVIWAEESATLSPTTNGGYQWSYGNGDTATVGLALPFDCTAVQMLFNCDSAGTSGSVELRKGTSTTSTTSSVVGSISFGAVISATTTFGTPQSFSAGDWMTFRTSAASGTYDDPRVGVVFEYDIADLTAYQGSQGPSGTSYDVTTITTSTTLSSSHTTKYLVCNSASAINLTVPPSASYDTYAEFVIEQRGAGQVTVVAGSGVTIHSTETLKSGAQYAVMGLKRTDTNTYVLTGEREAAP